MRHTFTNALGFEIIVCCESTFTKKPLIEFDLKSNERFDWDQNEGSSFIMTVKRSSDGQELIGKTHVQKATGITFRLIQGEVTAIW